MQGGLKMIDVLTKLSLLTTIDKKELIKLFEKINWCICDEIYNESLNGNYRYSFDLGFGNLSIDSSTGDSIRYKFTPSQELEKQIASTVINKQNPLTVKVEQSLIRKITETYKDLF